MAINQTTRCELERVGVGHALKLLKAQIRQSFKAPFDVVTDKFAYEVKSMSANSRDLKIHISDSSYKRKVKFAKTNKVKPVLLAIVISDSEVTVYKSKLKQSIRINQMRKVR